MKRNPIPTGYPSWNTFTALHLQSQERCKSLLDSLVSKEEPTPLELKLATFWKASMDEDSIESAGIAPLQPILSHVNAIVEASGTQDKALYAKLLGEMASKYGKSPFQSNL